MRIAAVKMERCGYRMGLIPPMVVWRFASTEPGALCVPVSGITMMPESCANNLDMTLKVVHVCVCVSMCMCMHVCVCWLHCPSLDARAMEGFGAAEAGPVFLSEVECTGTEEKLTLCPSVGAGNNECNLQDSGAGVACEKSTSES